MHIIGTIALIIVIVFIAITLLSSYRKSGPNEVLIITGGFLHGPFVQENPETHSKVKVVKGGGTFVWPIIQQAEIQNMDTFSIDVDVRNIMTIDAVPVNASANAVLRVGSDPKMIATASEKILGLSPEDREAQMQNIVRGSLREALSTMTPKAANDRKQFADNVLGATTETFNKMGLEITALQITELSDDNGYYESLYAKEVAEKQADATAARADAEARGRKAAAQREQEAQQVELETQRQIAANKRDTEVAEQQYQKDVNIQKAETEQAYELESNKRKAEVNIALKETNDAKFQAEIVTKQKADSDAKRIQIDVDKYQTVQQATAKAEQVKLEADANAHRIDAEGTANADAQTKMAEALAKNQQAVLAKAIIDHLPEIANAFAMAVGNIDNLTVFDGAEGVGRQANAGFVQSLEFIKQSTGIDIANVVEQRAAGTQTINAKLNPVPVDDKTDSKN